MPQDRLRSAFYRSFVTCHDPRDVMDCRTMRKSKTYDKKMDQVIEIRRNRSTVCRETREDFNGGSSFQLREISRESENLNQMIDSLSERMSSVRKSKDIAEDLLKGAFHLKKSLVFLGKFQDDTTVQFQKKERIQSQTQKTCSDYVGDRKNGPDELKKAIGLTVEKQNSCFNDEICLPERNLDSPSEISFTSSSKSSMESTHSSESSQKMGKGTNLIAKLMGLEQMPLESSLQATYQKKQQGKDTLHQQRSFCDAERPKTMKFQTLINGADEEKRTLKKILETMHFKGILESKSAKEFDPQLSYSQYSRSHQWEIDTATPIVLMKPAPYIHSDYQKRTIIQEETAVSAKKMSGKTNKKDRPKKRLEVKEIPLERTSWEERKKIINREEKMQKQIQTTMSKTSPPANGKPHWKHANAQKSVKMQKEIRTTPNPSVKKSVKVELVSRPQAQSKETSIRSKRPAIEADLGKKRCQTHLKRGSDQTDRKKDKKENSVKESRGAKSQNGDKEDCKRTDLLNETAPAYQNSSTSRMDLLLVEEKKDCRETEIGEFCNENQSSGEKQGFNNTTTNLKNLLLNSPLFINQAQNLLDISINDETILRSSERSDFQSPGTRLLFDCALELIEYKSLRESEAAFQLLLRSSMRENSRAETSLENMVEEICNAIQELASLRKIDGQNISEEAFCALLKRDVQGRENVTGLWDLGWRNSYSMEDAEKTVNYIEKLVFSELIEDIFA